MRPVELTVLLLDKVEKGLVVNVGLRNVRGADLIFSFIKVHKVFHFFINQLSEEAV